MVHSYATGIPTRFGGAYLQVSLHETTAINTQFGSRFPCNPCAFIRFLSFSKAEHLTGCAAAVLTFVRGAESIPKQSEL